jgi:hypothetical protein
VRLRPRHGPRCEYDYDWLTGPNNDDGFGVSGPFEHRDDDHKAQIEDFLADTDRSPTHGPAERMLQQKAHRDPDQTVSLSLSGLIDSVYGPCRPRSRSKPMRKSTAGRARRRIARLTSRVRPPVDAKGRRQESPTVRRGTRPR